MSIRRINYSKAISKGWTTKNKSKIYYCNSYKVSPLHNVCSFHTIKTDQRLLPYATWGSSTELAEERDAILAHPAVLMNQGDDFSDGKDQSSFLSQKRVMQWLNCVTFAEVANEIHQHGTKIMIQLLRVGIANPSFVAFVVVWLDDVGIIVEGIWYVDGPSSSLSLSPSLS